MPDRAPSPAYAGAAVGWLTKRRFAVPPALEAAAAQAVLPAAGQADEMQWLLSLLPGLKERERRALARHVEKSTRAVVSCVPDAASSASETEGSAAAGSLSWPDDVAFSNDYEWDGRVPPAVLERYGRRGVRRRRRAGLCTRVEVRKIDDESHPAHGERGLFAAVALPCGARVLDYVGCVSLGEHEDRSSDYVSEFGEDGELCLDARRVGNEARFVNDFRNTGRRQNVEFRLRRASDGELRQGVYVCARNGIAAGEELLISYGKSYWRARVGDLEAFITRLPGESGGAGAVRGGDSL